MAVKKHHQRTIDKMHLLVRLELENPQLNSTQVALLCGLSIVRFSVLKASALYKQIHNQYHTGLLSDMDKNIRMTYENTQKTLEFAVPIAMQGLVKQALQAKDERVKNKAFNDILDRDGHFAKVSRIGLPTNEQGGVAEQKDNEIAGELVKALNAGKNQQTINAAPTNIQSPPPTEKIQ